MQPQNPTDYNSTPQSNSGDYLLPENQPTVSLESIDGLTYEAINQADALDALRATGAVVFEQAAGAGEGGDRKPEPIDISQDLAASVSPDSSIGVVDFEKDLNSLYIDTMIIGENISAARRYKSSGINPSIEALSEFHILSADKASSAALQPGDDRSKFELAS